MFNVCHVLVEQINYKRAVLPRQLSLFENGQCSQALHLCCFVCASSRMQGLRSATWDDMAGLQRAVAVGTQQLPSKIEAKY